jgi:hypothetical protein
MTNYSVTVTMTVEVSNPSAVAAVAAIGGAAGADERGQVQAAANAGLDELTTVGRRYGFTISEASASVVEAE